MLAYQTGPLCFIFSSIENLPLLIKVVALVIVVALFMIAVTLIVINYHRNKIIADAIEAKETEELILDELNSHFLVYDSIAEIPQKEFDQTVSKLAQIKNRSAIARQVLVNLLVYFKHNLKGSITRIITTAYFRLNLADFTLSKLKSVFWFNKAKGLKELQEISNSQSAQPIIELLKDDHMEVRVEAYSALINLQKGDAFKYLSEEKEEFSEWHQILLFDIITKAELPQIPNFKNYLSSTNKSLVLLSIKLILYYHQFDAIPELIKLLDHPDENIRHEAICALGELNAIVAEEKLIAIYPKEHNRNKSQILLTIGHMATGNSIEFIKEKFLKAEHFTILKSAAAAIIAHPTALKNQILAGLTNLDDEQRAMIKHFEDPLIKAHGHH